MIEFEGRDYRRGSPIDAIPSDLVVRGETMGGGTIYGPDTDLTPTALIVKADGQTLPYGLIGGP
jgi:hypothetical protein